jgi:hypothetical protein
MLRVLRYARIPLFLHRTHYIKTGEDTEQRIIIQMHSIQRTQTDQSYDIECFLLSRF